MSKAKKKRGWRPWKPEEAIGKIVCHKDIPDAYHVITDAILAGVVIEGNVISYHNLLQNYEHLGIPCGIWSWVKVVKPEPGLGAMW